MGLHLKLLLIFFPLLCSATTVDPQLARQVKEHVQRFRAETRRVMFERPGLYTEDGKITHLFPISDLNKEEFLAYKRAQRARLFVTEENSLEGMGNVIGPAQNDLVENLVDNGAQVLRSLPEIERRGLLQSSLPADKRPWAGWIWPYDRGSLGSRYYDRTFRELQADFGHYRSYVLSRPIHGMSDDELKNISPSEKYDLVLGADVLTTASWELGQRFYARDGFVSGWFGHCNGWSYASMMYPAPVHAISLKSADGKRNVLFYPEDLKALATLAWAKNAPAEGTNENRILGGRCEVRRPQTDVNGRIIDPKCYDSNPATFLLALVNQIGISKRSMTMDANFDFEVWNFPIIGYSFFYFNLDDGETSAELEDDVLMLKSELEHDHFARYRAQGTKYLVGVHLSVTYRAFRTPQQNLVEDPRTDGATYVQRYKLDLELNSRKEIIGGEWHHTIHPDFLAVAGPNARAYTNNDRLALSQRAAIEVTEGQALPASVREMAKTPGRVSGLLVEKLLQLSRQQK